MNNQNLVDRDRQHVWHPYSSMGSEQPLYAVSKADGVRLTLEDGRELVDGMSSWWAAIHGYNHPVLNAAIESQLQNMSHVMFGGLTHEPAVALAEKLVELTPSPLQSVFFSDSGSVSVEVAMKMAVQYCHAKGQPEKQKFLTITKGYHGDTFGAMSVCDPVTGMHTLFNKLLASHLFVERPNCKFGEACSAEDIAPLEEMLNREHTSIAAVIMEPIVQGAGGMYFYSADYLRQVRALCDEYGVLLILDEIATGFGRTGKLFASEHADISADILCLGKALTGGYMSFAATLTTEEISTAISQGNPGVFMHGPTFMANPLAASVSLASINMLFESNWQANVLRIEQGLKSGLSPCKEIASVADVRVLGAIGVVEMKHPVIMEDIVPQCVERGIWLRPFNKLIYVMPPFIMGDDDVRFLTDALVRVVRDIR